jgi:hypothetical protein
MIYPVNHFRWYTMTGQTSNGKFGDTRSERRACSVCNCRIEPGERYAVAATETEHHRFKGVQTLCERHAREAAPC